MVWFFLCKEIIFICSHKSSTTDPAYAGDAHIPGTNVAWSAVESSLPPRHDHAFVRVGAVELARLH